MNGPSLVVVEALTRIVVNNPTSLRPGKIEKLLSHQCLGNGKVPLPVMNASMWRFNGVTCSFPQSSLTESVHCVRETHS
jgi:hypothetical protein